jgi:hypothetical protein
MYAVLGSFELSSENVKNRVKFCIIISYMKCLYWDYGTK